MAEPLHDAFQFARRLALQVRLDIPGQTFAEDFGSALQVTTQPALLSAHLDIRRQERNQGHAEDERDNQPSTQKSHAALRGRVPYRRAKEPRLRTRDHSTHSAGWPG